MSKSIFSVTGLKQTLVSGYGEGLTDKQKKALSFALEPGISDSQNAGGAVTEDIASRIATEVCE